MMKLVEIVLKKEKEGMREKDGRRVRLVMYCKPELKWAMGGVQEAECRFVSLKL
jgi:hypothetical protein